MKRLIFVAVAFLVGCNGMGSGANRFLPASPSGSDGAAVQAESQATPELRRGANTKVRLTMTIPKRHRHHGRDVEVHPSTISSQTQSVSIKVNGGSASVFNATPSSAACHAGPSGTVCTFVVNAPVGPDTFVIATYSSVGGGGTKLDQGSAVFNIVRGKNNAPSVRLGPVVTNTADTGLGSLRYAIAAASPGDTIMILLTAGSTITVGSPLTISNRIAIAGPGVSASARHHGGKRPHATYSGIKISGGGTQQIFAIQAGATVTISGLILTEGNGSTSPGGAIGNKGTLAVVGDIFTDNTTSLQGPLAIRAPHQRKVRKSTSHRSHASAPKPDGRIRHPHCTDVYQFGGAIYNNGYMTVSASTFDGNAEVTNTAACIFGYGGAIFNDKAGILTSSGNLYTDNSAYEGGAVYNYSEYGQATFTSDTFDSNTGCNADSGCPTSGCTTSCTSYAEGYGAAIYDDYGPGVSIASCVFSNNVDGGETPGSYGEGGALYLDDGQVNITNSSFTNNLAGGGTTMTSYGEGGAIYWDGSTVMHLTGDTFTGNRAAGDEGAEGGAIIAYEPIIGSGDKFSSNVAAGTGSAQYPNGYGYGGAIYEDDGMTLTGTTFNGNSATSSFTSQGGAIYIDDNVVLQGDTFTSNTATATGSTSASEAAEGGALYNDGGLSMKNNTLTSNKATITGSVPGDAYGGAIYNDDPLTTFNDSFVSNAATSPTAAAGVAYGGAVYNEYYMTMSGDTITSSSATGAFESYGGAIYNADANTSISNTTIASSMATASHEALGGGIYDEMGLTLSGSTLSANKASNGGGGIYASSAETIAGSTIKGNTVVSAGQYEGGGGIYIDSATTISNSTISGNTVMVASTYAGGGGIYNNAGLTIAGSTISGNTVSGSGSGSGGGGVFSYDTMAMTNSTIVGNHSGIDGGGYMTYGGYTNALSNVTLFQNSATGSGGNIANPYTMTLTNTIVAGGTAGTGADIDNPGTITSGDYNIVQTAVVGNALTGTTTHNVTVNPLLLALTNNGGPTFTNADQSASPGRADIPFSGGMCNGVTGTNIDQRGFTRGAGGRCDVGAYEFAGVASAIRPHLTPVRGNHHPHHHASAHRKPALPISATR